MELVEFEWVETKWLKKTVDQVSTCINIKKRGVPPIVRTQVRNFFFFLVSIPKTVLFNVTFVNFFLVSILLCKFIFRRFLLFRFFIFTVTFIIINFLLVLILLLHRFLLIFLRIRQKFIFKIILHQF